MSTCISLYTSNFACEEDRRDTSEPVEMCRARIPFLWGAMFTAADIEWSDSDDEPYLTFTTTVEEAARKLESRIENIFALLPEIFHVHVKDFIQCTRQSKRRYVHVDLFEIAATSGEPIGESAKSWGEVLEGLDTKITRVRSGLSRYVMGSGIPGSWYVLLAGAGLSSGLFVTKLLPIREGKSRLISGADSSNELDEWEL